MLERLKEFGNKLRHPVDRAKGKTETPTLRNGEDIPSPSVPTPVISHPARAESQLALLSLDTLVVIAEVPEIAKAWKKKGITNFDFFRLSAYQFERNGDYPGWTVKPDPWFWECVEIGRISSDATKLEEMLIAIDRTQKPDHDKGRQLYQHDPFAPLLKRLRKEKKIKVPRDFLRDSRVFIEDFGHIPETSRFGISPSELTEHVLPEIAKMLGVESNQVRLPKEIEFNVVGNRSHPEWGTTSTWEWMQEQDEFKHGFRLLGGRSGGGGLADAHFYWHERRDDVGFRPLVVLSPKA